MVLPCYCHSIIVRLCRIAGAIAFGLGPGRKRDMCVHSVINCPFIGALRATSQGRLQAAS